MCEVRTLDPCALCRKLSVLRRSHVIPEFCFKPIYDSKHRAVVFNVSSPSDTGFAQKGIRSRLLCDVCEKLINDRYEKPFLDHWIRKNQLQILSGSPCAVIRGLSYAEFKLFHLSVLLRASESDHPNFREVDLQDHTDEIRRMVLQNDAGPESKYPIICMALEKPGGGVWRNLIGPAHRITIGDAHGFYFVFADAQWHYMVDGDALELESIRFKEDGGLPVAVMPYSAAVKHYFKTNRPV